MDGWMDGWMNPKEAHGMMDEPMDDFYIIYILVNMMNPFINHAKQQKYCHGHTNQYLTHTWTHKYGASLT